MQKLCVIKVSRNPDQPKLKQEFITTASVKPSSNYQFIYRIQLPMEQKKSSDEDEKYFTGFLREKQSEYGRSQNSISFFQHYSISTIYPRRKVFSKEENTDQQPFLSLVESIQSRYGRFSTAGQNSGATCSLGFCHPQRCT